MEATAARKSNHGPNVKRWREWRGIKQDILAEQVGVSQGTLSLYESKEKLEPEMIEKLAKALDIPVEAITDINEGTCINIFSGTWEEGSLGGNNYQYNYSSNKATELYERLLKEQKERIDFLQELLKSKE